MSQKPIHVVFAEEDALFRLMEVGLRRALTPEGEKTLRYFFGDDFSAPLEELTLEEWYQTMDTNLKSTFLTV